MSFKIVIKDDKESGYIQTYLIPARGGVFLVKPWLRKGFRIKDVRDWLAEEVKKAKVETVKGDRV